MPLPHFAALTHHAGPLADGMAAERVWAQAVAEGGRKLVGTAQAWRRVAGVPVVLAHAVIVLDADPVALTAATNDFEEGLGASRRYRADALTSVAAEALRAGHNPGPWADRLALALRTHGLVGSS